jgi:hypothetical protein
MLAFKLPISLYEKYMTEAHHDAPLREEEKLTDTAEFLEQQAKSSKSVNNGRWQYGDWAA